MKVKIYDTTLRDGTQAANLSFSLGDKIEVALQLDELGIDYIEGGWPGSNPKDIQFFGEIKKHSLKKAKIVAFGSTRRKNTRTEEDSNLLKLLEAETEVVTIFGKSWAFHVKKVLRTDEDENLRMIEESVSYVKKRGREVIFDAEHFFDGFKENPAYALKILQVASLAGADCLVLCDSNGGSLPHEIEEIIESVKSKIKTPLGIHTHNDSGMAVANSIIAVRLGVEHIQGTINGYGERCGNADLCSVLPNLVFKMHIPCLSVEKLKSLTCISRFVNELANLPPNGHQPYVGKYAFAHKGGIHASGVSRDRKAYEHINPALVGNKRDILISELSGRGSVLYRLKGRKLDPKEMVSLSQKLIKQIKKMENQGYEFESADGSFELLAKKITGEYKKLFDLESFRVTVERRENGELISEATVKLKLKGKIIHTVAEGNGPVNALDKALRKALEQNYPELKAMYLADYKVRILDMGAGTRAKTRVLIDSCDEESHWGTVGVSPNIIEASWEALLDSIEYKLNRKQI